MNIHFGDGRLWYIVCYGDTVTLKCSVKNCNGPRPVMVKWVKRRNKDKNLTKLIKEIKEERDESDLRFTDFTIKHASEADNGFYNLCVGEEKSADVELNVFTYSVFLGQTLYTIKKGECITLKCTVTGGSKRTAILGDWVRRCSGDQSCKIKDTRTTWNEKTETLTTWLTIQSVSISDSGIYNYSVLNTKSEDITLDVYTLGIVPEQSRYTFEKGDSVTLQCTIECNADVNILPGTWVKKSNKIRDGTAKIKETRKELNKWTTITVMTIDSARTSDSGIYNYYLENGDKSANIELNVIKIVPKQETHALRHGESVTLQCTIYGGTEWTTMLGIWIRRNTKTTNGTEYISGERKEWDNGNKILTTFLTIEAISNNDAGFYNYYIHGIKSADIELFVFRLVPSKERYTVEAGEPITLQCMIEGFADRISHGNWIRPFKLIDFMFRNRNGRYIKETRRELNDRTHITTFLKINPARTSHSGIYKYSLHGIQSADIELNVYKIVPSEETYTVTDGEPVTLQCMIEGCSDRTTPGKWIGPMSNGILAFLGLKKRKYIEETRRETNDRTHMTTFLTINPARTSHSGIYNYSLDGIHSVDIELNVLKIVSTNTRLYTVVNGGSITLQCSFEGCTDKIASGIWNRRSYSTTDLTNEISETRRELNGRRNILTTFLTINSAGTSNSGIYNYLLHGIQSADIVLDVIREISMESLDYTMDYGSAFVLKCELVGISNAKSVFWQVRAQNFTAKRIHIDNSKYFGSTIRSPSLVIADANEYDEGSYVCTVETNEEDNVIKGNTVAVHVKDTLKLLVPKSKYRIDYGQHVTLECTLIGGPPANKFEWQKRVNVFSESTNVPGDESKYLLSTVNYPYLIILNADKKDIGTYTCVAKRHNRADIQSQSIELDVNILEYLSITIDPDNVVSYGGNITLNCNISGKPNPTSLQWKKNGKSLSRTDKTKYFGGTLVIPSLTIINADDQDPGSYSCHIQNDDVERSDSIQLIVKCELFSITIDPKYDVKYGESVTLKCNISCNPKPTTLQWKKNGEILSRTTNNKYTGGSLEAPSLTIVNVDIQDAGLYVCTIQKDDLQSSDSTQLIVECEPLSVTILEQHDVSYGKNITLKCYISGKPNPTTLQWMKDGTILSLTGNTKYTGATLETPSLTIVNVDRQDAGLYTCYIKRDEFQTSNSTQLRVKCEDFSITIDPHYEVRCGEIITLKCRISGEPKPTTLEWKKNGKTLSMTDNSRYTGGTLENPFLTIVQVDKQDAGSYSCRIKNEGLLNSATTHLSVKCEKLSVMVTDTSYTVHLNSSVTLNCSVAGYPLPYSVYWIKVKSGERILINPTLMNNTKYYMTFTERSSSLLINNADDNDEGVYQCIAENKLSHTQSEATYVLVLGGYRTVLDSFKLTSDVEKQETNRSIKYIPDTVKLKNRNKISINFDQLKVGMQLCFPRAAYNHHGIVTNVCHKTKTYEIIHMTGDKDTIMDKQINGIAEPRKERKSIEDDKLRFEFYEYGDHSIDRIFRKVHKIPDVDQSGSLVSKRARLLFEAFQILKQDANYQLLSFNCEHFASYCATGLAFCKQKDMIAMTENTLVTAILDQKLTIYCEETLGMKRPSDALLKELQNSIRWKNKFSEKENLAKIHQRSEALNKRKVRVCRLSEKEQFEEGMEIIVKRGSSRFHAIVTSVCLGRNSFELVYLADVKGEAVCQKIMIHFEDKVSYYDTIQNSTDETFLVRRDVTKLRADILFKSLYAMKDIKYDEKQFSCENFANYCVSGLAYRKPANDEQTHNELAQNILDKTLLNYCARFIDLPDC